MENVSETIKSSKSDKMGFIQYVFNFDDENKNNIMNMLQYTVLSIIPVILILKLTKTIFPEEDDTKGSLEITAESIGQLLIIMLGIWFTNKIIQFIPTYSGEAYHKFNEITFILPFMIILATMQTKLGAKFNILTNRVMALWTGQTADVSTQQAQQNNGVRVSQPFAGQGPQMQQQFHQPSQADHLDINQILPRNTQLTAMPQQQKPDFNQMYQNQAMGGQGQPMTEPFEPMAANGALGGMFGSSW